MATPVSGVNSWLTLNGKPLLFEPTTDNLAAGAQEFEENDLRLTRQAPDGLTIQVGDELLRTEIYGRWTWYPKGHAGLYDLIVSAPRGGEQRTQVRVLPTYLSYQRYEKMLEEISALSRDLLFRLRSPAYEWMNPGTLEQAQSPLRTYRLIETMMEELEEVVAGTARAPHQALVRHTVQQRWHEVVEYGSNITAVPGPAVALPVRNERMSTVWPLEWRTEQSTLTYDVYENRLLKHFLWRQLLPRLDEVATRAQAEIERRNVTLAVARKNGEKWKPTADREENTINELALVVARCQRLERAVIGWGSLPFLRDVSARPQRMVPTQVLQKHPVYGRFYRLYLRFQRELKRGLNSEGFLTRLAMRQMWELYETWANVRLTQILLIILQTHGYQTKADAGFFTVQDDLFHFEVDREAMIVLNKGDTEVRICYEPTYKAAKSVVEGIVTDRGHHRTPDLAVELWQDNRCQSLLIFDPKYKTDIVEEKPRQMNILAADRGPAQQDLDKMSTYYGEFAWKERGALGRLPGIVAAAYVLYPGAHLVHDQDYPTVGALPLIPGSLKQVTVANALSDLLQHAGMI